MRSKNVRLRPFAYKFDIFHHIQTHVTALVRMFHRHTILYYLTYSIRLLLLSHSFIFRVTSFISRYT